jgi:hypothetical protein
MRNEAAPDARPQTDGGNVPDSMDSVDSFNRSLLDETAVLIARIEKLK